MHKPDTSFNPASGSLNTRAITNKDKAITRTLIRNNGPDALWDAKIYSAQTKKPWGKILTEVLMSMDYEEVERAES